jgi:hypothetical protein
MAAHESPRTTTLYDRTRERLTQDDPMSTTITPKFGPIPVWMATSGMCAQWHIRGAGRRSTAGGQKGSKTLVDFEHGLAYLASLPPAKITTGHRRNRHRRHNAPVGSPIAPELEPDASTNC